MGSIESPSGTQRSRRRSSLANARSRSGRLTTEATNRAAAEIFGLLGFARGLGLVEATVREILWVSKMGETTNHDWLPNQSRNTEDLKAHVLAAAKSRDPAHWAQVAALTGAPIEAVDQEEVAVSALLANKESVRSGAEAIESVFEFYAAAGHWLDRNNPESLSGPGSTLKYTTSFRDAFEGFLERYNCRSLLDAPCGDFNWMKLVRFPPNLRYYGGDVSSTLTNMNRIRHQGGQRLFFQINLISEALPEADAWLCRDCLFHLSLEHATSVLKNALDSKFRHYLISSHYNDTNFEIVTGEFRELNLMKPPFRFPRPIEKFDDWIEGYPERYVGVWTHEQVQNAIMGD